MKTKDKTMYKIKFTDEMGRGLYASENLKIGATLMQCELLVLSQDDTKKVNDTDLKYYVFNYNENQDCIVLGDAEIFNHSDFGL